MLDCPKRRALSTSVLKTVRSRLSQLRRKANQEGFGSEFEIAYSQEGILQAQGNKVFPKRIFTEAIYKVNGW